MANKAEKIRLLWANMPNARGKAIVIAKLVDCAPMYVRQVVYAEEKTPRKLADHMPKGAPNGLPWSDERVEQLKRLQGDGFSAAQIAHRLGGFSHCFDGGRSAVIGKLHRLGLALSKRTDNPRRKATPRPSSPKGVIAKACGPKAATRPRPKFDEAPIPPPTVDDVPRKALLDLEDSDCRWPVNDPRDRNFGFCALPRAGGKPYCEVHLKRAEAPPVPRRRPSPATPNPSAPEAMEMGGGKVKETVG